MYKLFRPLLFKFQPETIHHGIVNLLRFAKWVPFAKPVMRAIFTYRDPSLEREVLGLKFPNPVGLAAGFDKDARVYDMLGTLGFGFIEIGTVTPKPQDGNPKPRCFRLVEDQAIINRMGFNNQGVDKAVARLRRRRPGLIIGGNIGKNTLTPNDQAPTDYLYAFTALYDHVDYFVVNVSCPNVASLRDLQSGDSTEAILLPLAEYRKEQKTRKPILLKISPDLDHEQVDHMIDTARACGLDGIVATNTTTSREGLKTSAETVAKIGNGGLSGKPLTERSRELVRYIHSKTEGKMPIIGVGGIMTEQDAADMLQAGASLVQVYSGFIYQGPGFVKKICKKLTRK